tara:strand:+ start:1863 stop:2123 length:261 start_codon:yes stop_codon:yes gene_type:complete
MASTDTVEDNTGFATKNDANFPILSDPGKAVCNAFGVLHERGFARRWTYYIDAEGIIRRIDKNVNPRNAGADLVRNLEELGFPKAS